MNILSTQGNISDGDVDNSEIHTGKIDDKKIKNQPSPLKPIRQTKEHGGYENKPNPTRYGDWEIRGKCTDF